MNNLPASPDDHGEPDAVRDAIVDDVEKLLRKFGGDDLTQQDAIRALGMWQRRHTLTAGERTAILARFAPAPDPGQAKMVGLLSSFEDRR